jgi:hypothetical protein
MKYKIDNNYLIILFFFCYFLTGTLIVGDYSVTPDEPLHRINGFISLKYITEFFGLNFDLTSQLKNIPNLHEDWRKTYGVIFDLPLAYLETVFKINNKSDIFLLRHSLTFLIFFVANIYFYFFIQKNLDNKGLAMIGVAMLITTPRFFSHSFYNSKDIIFLSMMIIAAYYSLNILKKFSFKNLFLSCLFCALATNIRVIGLYLTLLTFFFYYYKKKENFDIKTYQFFLLYFISYFFFLYLIWPFLWNNPIQNFFLVFSESMNYPAWWDFKTLYLGKFINPENLPWHYLFIWFAITTPIIFLLIIVFSIFTFIKNYFNYFIKIDFKNKVFLWDSKIQMINLYVFLIFFIPVFFVVCLNSTLYNGWRHLFFIYPFLIFLSVQTFSFIKKKFGTNYLKLSISIIILQFIFNFLFIFKSHPVQNIYFNHLAKNHIFGNLPIDYWGLGNNKTINFLLKNNKNIFLNISSASYSDLNNIHLSRDKHTLLLNKLSFNGTAKKTKLNADYIFTNYYYDRNPKNTKKYEIPENFYSYYKLIIDGTVINELFKKK